MLRPDIEQFYKEVCEVVCHIPEGKVLTYGDVARLVGYPCHSRLVARALSSLPAGHHVPAWRVVNSQGRTAPCWPQQQALLEAEGVVFRKAGFVEMKACRWQLL